MADITGLDDFKLETPIPDDILDPAAMNFHRQPFYGGQAGYGQQGAGQQWTGYSDQYPNGRLQTYQGWVLTPIVSEDEKTAVADWSQVPTFTPMNEDQQQLQARVVKKPYLPGLYIKKLGSKKEHIDNFLMRRNQEDNLLDPNTEWKLVCVLFTTKEVGAMLLKKTITTRLKVIFERKPRALYMNNMQDGINGSLHLPSMANGNDYNRFQGQQNYNAAQQNWPQTQGQYDYNHNTHYPMQSGNAYHGQDSYSGNPSKQYGSNAQVKLNSYNDTAVVDDSAGWTKGDDWNGHQSRGEDKAYKRQSDSPEIIVPSNRKRDSYRSSKQSSSADSDHWSPPGSPNSSSVSAASLLWSDKKRGSKSYHGHSRSDSYESGDGSYEISRRHSRSTRGSTSYPSRRASYRPSSRRDSELIVERHVSKQRERSLERQLERLELEQKATQVEHQMEMTRDREHKRHLTARVHQLEDAMLENERERELRRRDDDLMDVLQSERERELRLRDDDLRYDIRRPALGSRMHSYSTSSTRPRLGFDRSHRDRRYSYRE